MAARGAGNRQLFAALALPKEAKSEHSDDNDYAKDEGHGLLEG